MLIGFDASRAFVDEATGTENYSLSLLWALSKIDRKNSYRVYFRKISNFTFRKKTCSKQAFQISNLDWWPKNFEFVQVRPNRLWTQLGLALETWRNPVDVLFIPAHTLPVLRRRKWEVRNEKLDKEVGSGKNNLTSHFKNPASHIHLPTSFSKFFSKQTKYVVTIHDLGVEYLPGYHSYPGRYYLDLASKYASKEADALIAVSKATKADLIKTYRTSPNKVFVVAEGVDTGFFKPQSKSKVESVKSKYKIQGNYVLAVGTVQPRKNLEMLVRAFAEVIRRSGIQAVRKTAKPDSQYLVIAGKLGWDYQKIVDLPKKLGIGNKVKFLGYVDSKYMPALYTGSTVFAACSLFEGFGLPILEALACGCRVVASDIGAHREILGKISRNLKSAAFTKAAEPMVLVNPKDVDRWTQVLYQYISLYNNRLTLLSKKKKVEAVRRVLASEFNWEKAARETLRVLEEIGLK